MKAKLFTPVASQNPLYMGCADEILFEEILREHGRSTAAEIKEDGYRMQVHKQGGRIRAYTRSMKPFLLELYPELHPSLNALPDCILDTELIGDDKIGHEGFDIVKKRFRHRIGSKGAQDYLDSGIVDEMPLAARVFDTLYWEGKSMIDMPLSERRKITSEILEDKLTPSTQRIITEPEELRQWFDELTGANYEGFVCKNSQSAYLPGKQTKDWVKLKRSETLDLVVLGVYMVNGEISQILCGPYNPQTHKFETLAKVNAKRNAFNKELYPALRHHLDVQCPESIAVSQAIYTKPDTKPDYFVAPENSVVVEVAAMNFNYSKNWHSCGLKEGKSYSLRIAWLKSIRDDKKPADASITS